MILKPTIFKRAIFFLFLDLILSISTFYFSYELRFNFDIPSNFLNNFFVFASVISILKISFLYYFKIYYTPWKYFSLDSLEKMFKAHSLAYLLFFVFYSLTTDLLDPFARSIIIIDFILSILVLGALRISKRIFTENGNKTGLATIIIGTERDGEMVARYMSNKNSSHYPVAFVEDDINKIGSTIFNLKVVGFEDLDRTIKEHGVESVIIAKHLESKDLNNLFEKLKNLGIENIKLVQIFGERKEFKELSIEDLLARAPKDLDKTAIKTMLFDKVVLITGAGGSIGSELCRQALLYGVKKLILVDNSEYNLYTIDQDLKSTKTVLKLVSVTDKAKIEKIFMQYTLDVVIHAAAYKHVPLAEDNIDEVIENNIIGTKNIIDLSIEYNVNKFVLISTDKAVRPTNVMGATKRVCELYAGNVFNNNTNLISVRFGNVLGSSGSVVPLFKKQIANGGPITVTHPEVTRFFMLINEACQLVLQAASLGKGKEVFVLDMGSSVKIVDLAKKMIQLSNKENIDIKFTGLRAGEKLYEELLVDENDKKTQYDSIFVAKNCDYDIALLNKQIEKLQTSTQKLEILKEIVPEFNHQGK